MDHTILLLDCNPKNYQNDDNKNTQITTNQFDDIVQAAMKSLVVLQNRPFSVFDVYFVSSDVRRVLTNYSLPLQKKYVDIQAAFLDNLY